MWHAPTGKKLWQQQSGHVNTAAFSPDGKLVATGHWKAARSGRAWNYFVHVCDAATGKMLMMIKQ